MCTPDDDISVSTTATPDEPLEYAKHVRAKLGRRLKQTSLHYMNYDVEQNIMQIRALLGINAEIFDRCMSSLDDDNQILFRNDDTMRTRDIGSVDASFTRYGYDIIKARFGGMAGNDIKFTTEVNCSSHIFDLTPLLQLPPEVKNCIVARYKSQPYNNFISYESIFESILMFREDILEILLPKLKDHLEAVLVCLGEIDGWLTEPYDNLHYIKQTFGVTLEMPTQKDFMGQQTSAYIMGECQSKSQICLKCHCPLEVHNKVWSSGSDCQLKQYRCPKSNTFFQAKSYHVLKTLKYNYCAESILLLENGLGSKTSFAIGLEKEQRELERFLDRAEFLSNCTMGIPSRKENVQSKMDKPSCKRKHQEKDKHSKMYMSKSGGSKSNVIVSSPPRQRRRQFWKILKMRGKSLE